MRLRPIVLCLLYSASSFAADPAPQRVEITAPAEARRTVGRTSVQRAEMLAYGDSNLAEVLKRQPGVAVVDGQVRLRGLGAGYTAILIDGEPAPQGFSLESLAPELVERIEIARSATADQSAQAIAGSINIILRKRRADARGNLMLGMAHQHGHWSPSASAEAGARSGPLTWSLGATLERSDAPERIGAVTRRESAAGTLLAHRRNTLYGEVTQERVNLGPRLHWDFGGGTTLAWQTLAGTTRSQGRQRMDEVVLAGAPTEYPDNSAQLDARTTALRSELIWEQRPAGVGKLSVSALFDANRRSSDYLFEGRAPAPRPGLLRAVAAGADERVLGLKGKYLLPLGAAHSLGLGWDVARTGRDEHRHQFDRDTEGVAAAPLLQDYRAVVERLAWFVQDEWEAGEHLQAYAGLRWEGLRTATTGADIARVQARQSVFSPVAQLLWKRPGGGQWRLAIARTYKAPPPRDLVPRRFTVNNGNSATNPHFEGNPALLPELSWGLDAAYERALRQGGAATLSLYLKRVSNVTLQALTRDGAGWVARPVNGGGATAAGIEADIRTPLTLAGVRVDLRANAAANWSRVGAVPGPDNRLADQIPLSANLGVDHRAGGGWSFGANLNVQRGGASLAPSGLRSRRGTQALLDLYWSRKLGPAWMLRLSAVNALGRDRISGADYRDADGMHRSAVRAEGRASVRLTLKRDL